MHTKADNLGKAMQAFEAHGFNPRYFAGRDEAIDWLLKQVPAGSKAGVGGSVTVQQLGLADKLREQGAEVFWHWGVELDAEQRRELFFNCLKSDAYFCSANAVTEDGFILNVDGNGNRVAACAYGPKRLFIVAGINKLVADTDAALKRVEKVAPVNCKAKGFNNPCTESGICADCDSEERSCRVYLLMKRAPRMTDMNLVLIGEELGI